MDLIGHHGKVAFWAVYGGLQFGLGLFFAICVWKKNLLEGGLWCAFLSSIALAIARCTAIWHWREINSLIYQIWIIEIVMTILSAGILGYWKYSADKNLTEAHQ